MAKKAKNKSEKLLLLLDGNAIIHRAYHALPPLTTKTGKVVNAVYGFSMTLLSVIEKFHPTHVAASFDLAAPTFRHEEYKEYKAKRVKAPDELYEQIPVVKEVTKAFGIPIFEREGFEADDMIGSLAKLAAREDFRVVIVTGDMDTLQLVDDRISVFTMRRGIKDTVVYDVEGVRGKYGLAPEQLPDFKGLAGDASDNIPGVAGVGPKTASDLLGEYETLEGVFENLGDVKPALGEKIARDKMQAIASKRLGTIRTDAVGAFDEKACRFAFDDAVRENVRRAFADLEFYSLIGRLSEKGGKAPRVSKRSGKKRSAFVKVIDKKAREQFLETLAQASTCSFLAESSGVAVAFPSGAGYFAPLEKENEKVLAELFGGASLEKVTFDLKQAMHVLDNREMENAKDILLEAYVLGAGESIALEKLALSELGEELEEVGGEQETLFGAVSREKLSAQEAALIRRAESVLRIHRSLVEKIAEISKSQPEGRTVRDVLERIELPLVPVLARMERNGVAFDTRVFAGVSEKIAGDLETISRKIYDLAGREFNINSTKQLREVLFDELKIATKDIKKTKTGYSTASSELQKLKGEYPIAALIEEYREFFKIKTTYADVLPKLVSEDGRLRTTFHQAVTATGRLSSSDPNLQNIPVRTDLGRLLRTAFIAPDGRVLVSADYSQIDLRCAAHLSGDEKMMAAFRDGEDVHTATASEVFGVSLSQVTKAMRRQAKVLNFGVLYGMGTFGFMNAAGIARDEAQAFIDAYYEKFSTLSRYLAEVKDRARRDGFVETQLGRRRYIPEINSANFQVAAAGERMAVNLPIQGLTADIMKLAMIAADETLGGFDGAKMVLQIHDELIFEVPESIEGDFSKRIREAMESIYELRVPLVIDTASGRSWGEL